MDLLLDTQILVWIGTGSSRLSTRARSAIGAADNNLFVSAVTAFEFCELNARGRLGADLPFADIVGQIGAGFLDLPAELWRIVEGLPPHHADPVDRMLIAHAVHADLTLVTADGLMRRYPVKSLW